MRGSSIIQAYENTHHNHTGTTKPETKTHTHLQQVWNIFTSLACEAQTPSKLQQGPSTTPLYLLHKEGRHAHQARKAAGTVGGLLGGVVGACWTVLRRQTQRAIFPHRTGEGDRISGLTGESCRAIHCKIAQHPHQIFFIERTIYKQTQNNTHKKKPPQHALHKRIHNEQRWKKSTNEQQRTPCLIPQELILVAP